MATLALCSTAGRVAANEPNDASARPPAATTTPTNRAGTGVHSCYQGTWYVTSVTSLLGTMYDRNGNVTTDRTHAWWFQNGWGPELKQGWFDKLYAYASTL